MPHCDEEAQVLREHGINPTAQRVAVAEYVLHTDEHPSADEVWQHVREHFPMCSRATVYNTLNLFVERGLLQALTLTEGNVVFDPKVDPHHHFIDEDTGEIHDIPWKAVSVGKIDRLDGFVVRDYQVVMRGRRTGKRRR